MKITALDGLTRFEIESDAGNGTYLVDLGEYDGNGKCTCKHFECRMAKFLNDGERATPATPDIFQCKHIRACRESLGKDLVDTVVKQTHT